MLPGRGQRDRAMRAIRPESPGRCRAARPVVPTIISRKKTSGDASARRRCRTSRHLQASCRG
ncbi:hypothetical protein BSLA_03f0465 [Burkholderia stabilis]|nr:hypothetical protein BSLA_03f0465 [Burkholderia stabilis]